MIDPIIADAREAWARIKDRDRATFADWLAIGRALIAARQECMAKAGVNSPYGPAYQKLMRGWLDANGLTEVDSHERTNAIKCVEHQVEIEKWRAGLSDVERRRCNHPNSVIAHWRRKTRPRRPGPKRSAIKPHPRAEFRPIFWNQDFIRRAADAMREANSADLFRLARAALEAAIRNEADLFALLDEAKPQAAATPAKKSASRQRIAPDDSPAVVSA